MRSGFPGFSWKRNFRLNEEHNSHVSSKHHLDIIFGLWQYRKVGLAFPGKVNSRLNEEHNSQCFMETKRYLAISD